MEIHKRPSMMNLQKCAQQTRIEWKVLIENIMNNWYYLRLIFLDLDTIVGAAVSTINSVCVCSVVILFLFSFSFISLKYLQSINHLVLEWWWTSWNRYLSVLSLEACKWWFIWIFKKREREWKKWKKIPTFKRFGWTTILNELNDRSR